MMSEIFSDPVIKVLAIPFFSAMAIAGILIMTVWARRFALCNIRFARDFNKSLGEGDNIFKAIDKAGWEFWPKPMVIWIVRGQGFIVFAISAFVLYLFITA